MLKKEAEKKREQMQCFCMDELVPKDHLLRQVEAVLDLRFIYPLIESKYSPDKGRPSLDPAILVKMAMIQHLFGIRSMRQTVKEIEVNNAYRWFLGLDLYDKVPHFTTFGKNYKRRFEGTDLFEQIFAKVLASCMERGFVREETAFVDATHIKASANRHKKIKVQATQDAKEYAQALREEINQDREAHGKKGFDDDDDLPPPTKEVTRSLTDPDSGMFVKGEHKRDFAYMASTGCDRHGFILAYDVCAGNVHDSVSFTGLYEKLKAFSPVMLTMDAGYKTPAIVRKLIHDGIVPVLPRTNPKTGEGFFYKREYVYDEFYDCYLCPTNKVLSYSTTNRDGYREYKSKSYICQGCAHLDRCTKSRDHTKVVTRHVWQSYMDMAEEFRLTLGMAAVYRKRKETIERVFADAKEKHGMRYTQLRGLSRVTAEIGLIFACMNLKKMARWVAKSSSFLPLQGIFLRLCPRFTQKRGISAAFAA